MEYTSTFDGALRPQTHRSEARQGLLKEEDYKYGKTSVRVWLIPSGLYYLTPEILIQ